MCGHVIYLSLGLFVALMTSSAAAPDFLQIPRTAFSAGLTQMVELHQPTNVTFDRVWVNVGDAYDNNTGLFTAPIAGSYFFMLHGLADQDGQLWLDLYRNSQYELSGYAHTEGDYDAASNAVVLDLDAGDVVYVQARGDNWLYGKIDEVYGTFSGYLLFPHH